MKDQYKQCAALEKWNCSKVLLRISDLQNVQEANVLLVCGLCPLGIVRGLIWWCLLPLAKWLCVYVAQHVQDLDSVDCSLHGDIKLHQVS